MRLYHQPWSPNCQKVLIAVNELGVVEDVELVAHNPFEGREPWFVALNPAHKVPVLDDDGAVFWESGAIVQHLAAKFGGLLPDDPADRAMATTLVYYESCNVAPTIGGEGLFGEMFRPDGGDAQFIERMKARLPGRLAVLDAVLADGRAYFARTFSIADVQLYPGMSKVVQLEGLAVAPTVMAWAERVGARPAVQKVYAEVAAAAGAQAR